MKVNISAMSTKADDDLLYRTWTTGGGCFGGIGCYDCILNNATDCDVTEVFALAVAIVHKLPCVVDTDDYPELFI